MAEKRPFDPSDEAPDGTAASDDDICPSCHGTGRLDGEECVTCAGAGVIVEGIGGG